MGLDVYVGTFTRYYQRDWLTAAQQSFPGQVHIVRPGGQEQGAADPDDVKRIVAGWSERLAGDLGLSRRWSEDESRPYFTNKPAWDGYGGLQIWAAYDDQGLRLEDQRAGLRPENWSEDPAFKRYADLTVETRYPQLLLGEEIWLPIASPAVFQSCDATGQQRLFGNCAKLLAELVLLNERTWKASASTAAGWLEGGLEFGSSIEASARFGWALMHNLAQQAVAHELAIILDY